MLCLELCNGHEGLASRLVHVDGALIDTLLFFTFDNGHRLAVDDGDDGELLLGLGLFQATGLVPSGTFNLESEDVSTVTVLLLG